MKPIDDRVIIEPDPFDKETSGGLVIPDFMHNDSNVKCHTGTVVAIGEGKLTSLGVRVPSELSAGDRVLYSKIAGTILKDEGHVGHILLKESEIFTTI